MQKIDSINIR